MIRRHLLTGFMAASTLLLAMAACSAPASNARTIYQAPDPATFPPLGDTLENHCGSLDCHGNIARNLRVYGVNGMRLDPNDVTGFENNTGSASKTTQAEYDATYRSVTMIEPELMGEVIDHHGADPQLLTIVRKARGTEKHKGGAPMPPGSPGDLCLVSWLAGQIDKAACGACADLNACCNSPHMPPNVVSFCQQAVTSNDNLVCTGALSKYKLAAYCN